MKTRGTLEEWEHSTYLHIPLEVTKKVVFVIKTMPQSANMKK